MIISLSGIHGIGKTTVVKELQIDAPLCRYTDIDMIIPTDDVVKGQILRGFIMEEVLLNIPREINTILDRSPLDFYIYNAILNEKNSPGWKLCNDFNDVLKGHFLALNDIKHVLVYDDLDLVKQKIKIRGREGYQEDDPSFTNRAYELFYSGNGASFEELTGVKPILIHIDDLTEYLFSLLI